MVTATPTTAITTPAFAHLDSIMTLTEFTDGVDAAVVTLGTTVCFHSSDCFSLSGILTRVNRVRQGKPFSIQGGFWVRRRELVRLPPVCQTIYRLAPRSAILG